MTWTLKMGANSVCIATWPFKCCNKLGTECPVRDSYENLQWHKVSRVTRSVTLGLVLMCVKGLCWQL
jgi:hypothetical protein